MWHVHPNDKIYMKYPLNSNRPLNHICHRADQSHNGTVFTVSSLIGLDKLSVIIPSL